ncbi:acyltransferase family protein [Flavilitoribacter nigricans]|uniref:DUF5009 domain-containing protein n=1 Tax=Flavilitoribacter nigricans (strain ATCC 23147 / DSM 23189 / NBRC 102662 / NCIMB 1420 / SS-2) TaxID=1122177 RepID=A0A2D0NF12_FLAN2|nr:DUF5009 domain-containing protein [Flavilitoribacter nigricans]PHN07101.1 DUF5009 domain-containing protein [Flavilitoribacter nigricans DSM 23189 = NBRC 102662]
MSQPLPSNRLTSLDTYRGITMFLLVAEAAGVYAAFSGYFSEESLGGHIIRQFHHHPWAGLRFWDLIQPFFMFIVGVAMPFSLRARLKRGDTWSEAFRHILIRCFLLLLFGVGLHCIYRDRIVWELWNVLTQLSFTILVTFLLMRLKWQTQLAVSIGLLLLTELLYRTYDPAAPFVKDENFGSYMDMILMGKINPGGGWVTINCLPTAAHTIWGAICGKLLLSDISPSGKNKIEGKEQSAPAAPSMDPVKPLLIAGAIGLFIGYGMHFSAVTPIIKRIATTSFVFASGGWCLLVLAFFYWFVDIKGHKDWARTFIIVGMNPIFIYLFAETIGHQWLTKKTMIFANGFLAPIGFSEAWIAIFNSFLALGVMWYLCYFLYKKKIFIRI